MILKYEYPDNEANQLLEQAKLARRRNDDEEVFSLIKKAYEVDPNHPGAATAYAGRLIKNKEFEEADRILHLCLESYPSDFLAHLHIAQSMFWQRNYQKAEKYVSTAIELSWDQGSEEQSRAYFVLGAILKNSGKIDTIEDYIDKALEKNPHNFAGLKYMAELQMKKGSYRESQKMAGRLFVSAKDQGDEEYMIIAQELIQQAHEALNLPSEPSGATLG
ncbi:MAG: hypothetical protein DHS20C02_15830 [Micavibrio sp.]|nr:MAG: hypothetical protein DHS20C02_15830 [Micavibrio sp.]